MKVAAFHTRQTTSETRPVKVYLKEIGRVIAVPVAAYLVTHERTRRLLARPSFFCLAAATFLVTNFVFAYYFMWVT